MLQGIEFCLFCYRIFLDLFGASSVDKHHIERSRVVCNNKHSILGTAVGKYRAFCSTKLDKQDLRSFFV